jgi:hypothetical protein
MRFRLRTLLILVAILPPIIAGIFHDRNRRALQVLRSLERTQIKRDTLLETWRAIYGRDGAGQEEAAIREQWNTAYQDFKREKAEIEARYGSMEAARKLGAQAEQFER